MINIIVAASENNVIGKNNDLIWHISKDLRRFKKITSGHPIILGRKTFDSFQNKPLPNRHHFIISRDQHENSEQVTWVNSLEKAIELALALDEEIFIIGGGNIYQQSMPLADKIEMTRIHKDFEGDTFFPQIPDDFICIRDEKHWDESVDFNYSFRTYLKREYLNKI